MAAKHTAHPGDDSHGRVDIGKDQDLRHWSRALDVPADELVRAVAQVGDDPRRVEQHLRQGGGRSERWSPRGERS